MSVIHMLCGAYLDLLFVQWAANIPALHAVQPGTDVPTTAPHGQNVENHLKVLHDTVVSDFKETDTCIDYVQ